MHLGNSILQKVCSVRHFKPLFLYLLRLLFVLTYQYVGKQTVLFHFINFTFPFRSLFGLPLWWLSSPSFTNLVYSLLQLSFFDPTGNLTHSDVHIFNSLTLLHWCQFLGPRLPSSKSDNSQEAFCLGFQPQLYYGHNFRLGIASIAFAFHLPVELVHDSTTGD